MELKQLEYFTIVCEKGSFSQAAECLYTSQPNVSKVISSLEKELGRKLVERSSRGLRITPYGETVRDYAKVILKHASLISSMATHHNGKKFTLATYPSNMCLCGTQSPILRERLRGFLRAVQLALHRGGTGLLFYGASSGPGLIGCYQHQRFELFHLLE